MLKEVKNYPVHWIKLVEKLDEAAFHRKHMFQVVISPHTPEGINKQDEEFTLYLQAGVGHCVEGGREGSVWMCE